MTQQGQLIFFLMMLVPFIACKKVQDDGPVNASENDTNLECATCPSSFFTIEAVLPTELCENFTDLDEYPPTTPPSGETIGYSEDGLYPIIYTNDFDWLQVNLELPGLYGSGNLDFLFNGETQIAQFEMYAYDYEFTEMSFRVNGNTEVYISDDFPLITGGVTVDLDSLTDSGEGYQYALLTFTGSIENIQIYLFESGLTRLCVTHPASGPPLVNELGYVSFDDFKNYAGTVLGSYPNTKTPLGYYGLQATNITVNFDKFLAYSPTRLSFVHAYYEGGSNLINVQLPGTPLLVTVPDSLNYYLTPYGYNAINYTTEDGLLWQNSGSPPLTGAWIDSIIITGKNMNTVTVGANLQESELRSICTYYEQ